MAITVDGKIATAVLRRAQTLPGGLPIAWPGVDFSPETDAPAGKWIRVQHIPNTVERMTFDGLHRLRGLMQVTVFCPKGRGEIEIRDMAGAVVEHFPADLTLTEDGLTVRIMQRPEARDTMTDDLGVFIPVMIQWESWV